MPLFKGINNEKFTYNKDGLFNGGMIIPLSGYGLYKLVDNMGLNALSLSFVGRPPFFSDLLFYGAKGSSQDFANKNKEIINDPDFILNPQIDNNPVEGDRVVVQWGLDGGSSGVPIYDDINNRIGIRSSYDFVNNMYAEVFLENKEQKIEVVVDEVTDGASMEVLFEGVVVDTITSTGTYNYTYTGTGGDGRIKFLGKSQTFPDTGYVYISRVSVTRFVYMTNFAEKNYLVPDTETVGRVLTYNSINSNSKFTAVTLSGDFTISWSGKGQVANDTILGLSTDALNYINANDLTDFKFKSSTGTEQTLTLTDFDNTLDQEITLIRESGTITAYVDGVSQDTATDSGDLIIDAVAQNNGTNFASGSIYNLSILTRAITATELSDIWTTAVNECRNNPTGIGFWLFDFPNPASATVKNQGLLGGDATIFNADLATDVSQQELLSANSDFSDPVWVRSNITVVTDDKIAPDGTMTADKITGSIAGSEIFYSPIINPTKEALYNSFQTGFFMYSELDITISIKIFSYAGEEVTYPINLIGGEWNNIKRQYTFADGDSGDVGVTIKPSTNTIWIWGASLMEQGTVRPSFTQQEGVNIANNLVRYSEDVSDSFWSKVANATTSGTDVVNLPSVGDELRGEYVKSIKVGDKYIGYRVLSGSGTVSLRINRGGAGTNEGTIKQITLTATPNLYFVEHTFVNIQTAVRLDIIRNTGDTATSVTTTEALLTDKYNGYYPTTTTAFDNEVIHADLQNLGYDTNGVEIVYKAKQGLLNDNYATMLRYPGNALMKIADADNNFYDALGNPLDVSWLDHYYIGWYNSGFTYFQDISKANERLIRNIFFFKTPHIANERIILLYFNNGAEPYLTTEGAYPCTDGNYICVKEVPVL